MKNVLVFPCGSEIGHEIYRSLRYSKDFKLFGASSVDDHGKFLYENYISGLPFVNDSKFLDRVNEVVDKHNIDFIFPAHDSVVLKLAQNSRKVNAKIITSPAETCEVARSKKATYKLLGTVINVPQVYKQGESLNFPLFLKPEVGQGSKGTLIANNPGDVTTALAKDDSLMILEYLPGDEYTIDCFSNSSGNLLFAQARIRNRIMNGISVNSKVIIDSQISDIAEKINSKLEFNGVWFFQLKKDKNNKYVLLEIAPRVAGTMTLCRVQGVNLPLLSLYDSMGISTSIFKNNFQVEIDRALQARYKTDITYSKVYVDFDDTIIIDGKVNEPLIAFLYKNINLGKKIILITKHLDDVKETLSKYRIAGSLFDQIINLEMGDNKSDHITEDSIFIDDSFSERKKVFDKIRIPVFDVGEAVELL